MIIYTKPQDNPTVNDYQAVAESVIDDIRERMADGTKKYGTALQPFNGRNALVDAYQEVLDLAQYIKQRLVEDELMASQPIAVELKYNTWRKFNEIDIKEYVIGTLLAVLCVDQDGEVFSDLGYLDEINDKKFAIRQSATTNGTLRFWFDRESHVVLENDICEILTDLF